MKSARTIAPGQVEIHESPIPAAGPGQVLVKMLSVGICASDVQVYHGKHKYAKFPLVQGHEGIGVVEAAGAGVAHVKRGDYVNIQQQLACGSCYACKKGRHNVCLSLKGIGILADGLFTEYFLSPAWNVIKLPEGFGIDRGMLVEPTSVGVNSARVARIRPGERAVILGAGIIGNLTAQVCLALGAADVLVTDIAGEKLEIAERDGIPHCLNTRELGLKDAIGQAFAGNPPDLVFDCAGVPASIHSALEVAANASRVVIVANFKEAVTFEIPSFQRREIAILSVMGTVKESSVEAIELLAKGKVRLDGVISRRFPLSRMGEAYQYVDDNPATVMKVAIDIAPDA
ncbi:MAG: alcohol dehydrogenase catalytic domain-containing protein [Planctomycetota bacterium]|jgi:L-iditol 2-dehydrogenase|nr:alcohol dehydrogenase catalytic domain-containing protein [Planctomycetota bacterium]